MEKRSLTLAGHRTSVSLEPDFWRVLEEISAVRKISLSALVYETDQNRGDGNLASALRLTALDWYRERARTGSGTPSGPG